MIKISKILFCTFILISFFSCEPEDLKEVEEKENIIHDNSIVPVGDTGNQGNPIDDDKD